ncbi:MFS transporter [Streptomyces agglomeratus]|uniref:MFS transporter n=1 Tax=Streptomyces agglomeratus TaxID=285458 RepID=UPI0009A03BAA|nr:MFS transporter [Streptomyces agglomeratus]
MTATSPTSTSAAPERAAVPWGRVSALVGGQAAVQLGSFGLLIAMNWTAVQMGGTKAVTLLMLAATVPRALMLVFGGAFADTLGPRFVLLRTTSARAALLGVGAVVTATTHELWPLVLIALVEGMLLGLAGPASGVLLPRFASGDQLARANSAYATVLRVAPILGTPAGAWLITVGELWVAFVAAAVTGAIWLGCLLYITHGFTRPVRQQGGPSLLRRSGDGFRLLARYPRLRWMFVACLCLDMAFSWPAEVALPLLAHQRGWGVGAVAMVLAAFSFGALASSALGAAFAHRIPVFVRLVVTGAGLAVGITMMALMASPLSLTAVAAAVGLLSGLNGPAIVTLYQQAAPQDRMGAAMSTLSLAGIGTAPLSIALFSSLSLVLGVQQTWLLCGAIAAVSPVAAVLALRQRPTGESPAQAAEYENRVEGPAGATEHRRPAGDLVPGAPGEQTREKPAPGTADSPVAAPA